ncbi:MAG: type III pantothenate kinase [Bacteroidaceae bacterium]|jgi:type III pantothenate kinase|nr:type III pantothenate kinase [Bacteroidaceae bacterium]
MKLLIDIGNTSAKLAVMDDGILHYERRHESWSDTFSRLMSQYPISDVRLSTVAGEDAELNEALAQLNVPVRWLSAAVPCPVKPIANVPLGLGADRWAADIGAIVQDPDHTLLVIDAGTCLTYDVIAREGAYLGGAISPGVQLRLNAMHEHTALLPQIEAEQEAVLLGYDTRTHMLSAAVNGTRFEIEGYIRQLLGMYPDLHVFITGGNTFQFSEDITCPITHDPYLVFKGLGSL